MFIIFNCLFISNSWNFKMAKSVSETRIMCMSHSIPKLEIVKPTIRGRSGMQR